MYQYHHQFLNISSDRIFIFLFASIPSFSEVFHNLSRFFFLKVNLVSQWFFSMFFHDFSWVFMVFPCFFPCFFIWMAGSDLHHQQQLFCAGPDHQGPWNSKSSAVAWRPYGFGWSKIGMTPSGYLTYIYIIIPIIIVIIIVIVMIITIIYIYIYT